MNGRYIVYIDGKVVGLLHYFPQRMYIKNSFMYSNSKNLQSPLTKAYIKFGHLRDKNQTLTILHETEASEEDYDLACNAEWNK